MKRKDIVKKLISEGLSEKFLSNLTDKQLQELSDRILSEAVYKVSADKVDQIKDKVSDDDTIEVTEEDEDVEESSSAAQQAAIAISMKKAGKKPKKEMNEWVESVVTKNFHGEVTTKEEIYEMIGSLSDSADRLVAAQSMFSVDEQQPSPSKPDTDTPVREKPTTKPDKPKRRNPFEPRRSPRPKADLPKELTFKSLGLDFKQAAE